MDMRRIKVKREEEEGEEKEKEKEEVRTQGRGEEGKEGMAAMAIQRKESCE